MHFWASYTQNLKNKVNPKIVHLVRVVVKTKTDLMIPMYINTLFFNVKTSVKTSMYQLTQKLIPWETLSKPECKY